MRAVSGFGAVIGLGLLLRRGLGDRQQRAVSGGENPRIDGALVWVGDVWRRETSCPEGFGNCVLDLGIWSATVAARRSA
jgi:hypothetical protein